MVETRVGSSRGLSDLLAILAAVAFTAVGVAYVLNSPSQAMQFHGAVFALAAVLAGLYIITHMGSRGIGDDFYMDGPTKFATIAAVFWGVAGFIVGDLIAWQLAFPALNMDLPFTTFGRLRPLHTSAVIFAFGGNVLLATSLYIVQRTCHARLPGRWLPWFVVFGYNVFIAIAGTGYLLGITEGKEYAEPEWYADLWLTLVWVAYLLVFMATIMKRREPHIYVANWFFISFIVTIAMLHLVNNATVPVSFASHCRR